ncbi:MAG: hypothetical protein C5B57_08590 [Blastocatellia bacterium]|nr:MAG: hypothetical protein C5B57_08590 [Blastocatellia bacterium]
MDTRGRANNNNSPQNRAARIKNTFVTADAAPLRTRPRKHEDTKKQQSFLRDFVPSWLVCRGIDKRWV